MKRKTELTADDVFGDDCKRFKQDSQRIQQEKDNQDLEFMIIEPTFIDGECHYKIPKMEGKRIEGVYMTINTELIEPIEYQGRLLTSIDELLLPDERIRNNIDERARNTIDEILKIKPKEKKSSKGKNKSKRKK